MTTPDTNTWLIIAINVAAYYVMFWRNKNKETIRRYQHEKMWKEYARNHHINGDDKEFIEETST